MEWALSNSRVNICHLFNSNDLKCLVFGFVFLSMCSLESSYIIYVRIFALHWSFSADLTSSHTMIGQLCTMSARYWSNYFSSLPSASIYPDQEDMPRKKRMYGHPCIFIRNAIIVHNNIVHNNSCLFVSFIKYVLWAEYVPSCRCITSSLCF